MKASATAAAAASTMNANVNADFAMSAVARVSRPVLSHRVSIFLARGNSGPPSLPRRWHCDSFQTVTFPRRLVGDYVVCL